MKLWQFPDPVRWRSVAVITGLATVIVLGTVVTNFSSSQQEIEQQLNPNDLPRALSPNAIGALGVLEPAGEVIQLSAPAFAEGARVEKLLVQAGDRVKAGQVIAILDSQARLNAAVERTKTQLKIAQTRLAQLKAGAKVGEIEAQKARVKTLKAELQGKILAQQAAIERLQADLQGEKQAQQATIERLQAEAINTQTDCDRHQILYQDGAIAISELDSKCLASATAKEHLTEAQVTLTKIIASRRQEINEAKANLITTITTLQQQESEALATLDKISEVRPIDLAVGQAELEDAQAAVKQAQAELALAYVRTPTTGQVLKINTHQGELVGEKGILDIGQTQHMYVRAEVYETDISQVLVGQRATITNRSFPGKLQGTVDEIKLQIGKKDILDTDPVADADARVVEVMIRLDAADSQRVSSLTNLKVNVVIITVQKPLSKK